MWVACSIFYTFTTHMTCAHIGLQIYELCSPTPIVPCLVGHTAGCSSRGDQDGDQNLRGQPRSCIFSRAYIAKTVQDGHTVTIINDGYLKFHLILFPFTLSDLQRSIKVMHVCRTAISKAVPDGHLGITYRSEVYLALFFGPWMTLQYKRIIKQLHVLDGLYFGNTR